MLTLRGIDDRGRDVRVPAGLIVDLFRGLGRSAAARVRGRFRPWRLASRVVRVAASGPVLVAAGMTAMVLMVGIWLYKDTSVGLGMLVFSPIWVPVFMSALVSGRGALGMGGGLAADVQATVLATGRCPGCRFDLSAGEAEADGCVVCPECGSAWRGKRLAAEGGEQEVEVIVWGEGEEEEDHAGEVTGRIAAPGDGEGGAGGA